MQAKRIQIKQIQKSAGQQTFVELIVPTDPREMVNFHNIWAQFSCESVVADANANGWWILYTNKENQTVPTFTETILNNETNNVNIIACGTWMASNQSPHTSDPIHPMSSRNMNAGDQLILIVFVNGSSSGAVQINATLCAHTVRK